MVRELNATGVWRDVRPNSCERSGPNFATLGLLYRCERRVSRAVDRC